MKCALLGAALALLACAAAPAGAADHIKIGALKTGGAGPLFIAIDKGYFTAEGLDAAMVYFEAAQPTAVATVSGDVDFGVTGLTAGFYNLASHGALRIVGAQGREAKGFHNVFFLESRRAWDGGLKSLKDLGGHSVAITQTGTPGHYAVGLAAEKYGLALSSIRILTLQSVPNIVSAVIGGQADAGATVITLAMVPAIDRGDLKPLAWVSDEFPFQDRAIFVSTKTANDRRDLIERFFRAFRKGAQDYHDAFIGPDEAPHDGPTAAATLALIGKYTGQPPEAVRIGIAYIDPSLRIDVTDVMRQIAWYKSQGMVKPDVNGAEILDKRYVVPLPGESMP
jgi:NitT/TauT family transport system substrate-binding protein